MNIFINIQLQHKKGQSPHIIYLVCPGVKLKKKDKMKYIKIKSK